MIKWPPQGINNVSGNLTGIIQMYAGSTAPNGWKICDGSAISRTTYSALFNVIGVSYGAGDGTTTYNIPNLNGKVPVGLNSLEPEFDTLGKSGGEKSHLLTSVESGSPAHNHPITAKLQAYGTTYNEPNTGSDGQGNWGTTYTNNSTAVDASSAHQNLQPYCTINMIIKY